MNDIQDLISNTLLESSGRYVFSPICLQYFIFYITNISNALNSTTIDGLKEQFQLISSSSFATEIFNDFLDYHADGNYKDFKNFILTSICNKIIRPMLNIRGAVQTTINTDDGPIVDPSNNNNFIFVIFFI